MIHTIMVDGVNNMHHLATVLVKPPKDMKTSKAIREHVYFALINSGFIDDYETDEDDEIIIPEGEEKRFSPGIANWFVIGGRWSGELARSILNKLVYSAYEEAAGKLWNKLLKSEDEDHVAKEFTKLFKSYFPNHKGPCPVGRSSRKYYDHFGSRDDAQPVTNLLWNRFIKEALEESTADSGEGPIIFLEDEWIGGKEDIVGKFWAVLIDYHT